MGSGAEDGRRADVQYRRVSVASETPSLQEVAEMTRWVTFLFLLSQGSTHWHTGPVLKALGEPLQTP